ncbi:MAG: hypothetical protein WC427_02960 [Candidatus Paceibacterota bacterium]|jgi:hypothetical protein
MAIELNSTEKDPSSPVVNILFALSIVALIASMAIFAYFHFIVEKQQNAQIQEIQSEIAKQKSETSGYSEEDLIAIGKKVNDYKILMEKRPFASKFFDVFEKWVHPQVYFTNFSLDPISRTVALEGVVNDFQPLIQQIAILKNNQTTIESYDISNIKMADKGGVNFSINLVVRPEVLK